MLKTLTTLLALGASAALATDACNGYLELCSRPYGDVTFVAAHNAAFVGYFLADNQHRSIEWDLDFGIRYFTTQTHNYHDEIKQCHTSCSLKSAGDLSRLLNPLKAWMDKNPREVVTLLITNGDNIDIGKYAEEFKTAGLADLAYTPSGPAGKDGWPTLGDMIDSGKRLVVFMDYHADTSKVPYILPQYDYYVETPFSPTKHIFFNCDVDRPQKFGSADNRMIFMNHNMNHDLAPNEHWMINPLLPDDFDADILIPAPNDAEEINSIANIQQQSEICKHNFGRNPNVVMLDFVNHGDVMGAQKQLNGL